MEINAGCYEVPDIGGMLRPLSTSWTLIGPDLLRLGMTLALAVMLALASAMAVGRPVQAQAVRVGFEILTRADDPEIEEGRAIVRYRGPIEFPMAENLAEIGAELARRFPTIVLDLSSDGGKIAHTEKVIAVLADLRRSVRLETLVGHGHRCLSACVPVFMQGTRRTAGGSSAWLFHGACRAFTNVPTPEATARFLGMLRDAGVAEDFLCRLEGKGVFSEPGRYWLSGYELHHVEKAGIITDLIPAWRPEERLRPPFEPQLQRR